MLTRVKTFDATGVAPNGKLYAGDLNAIQDAVAAASDLTQTIGAASYQVGESGLTIVRFGAGEARVTGALRTDGKIRAGGGLDAGMTTAQRDAIPPGSRPPGTLIFNTTTGRPEANMGSDASPSWQGQYIEFPVGAIVDWPWASAGIPSWAALCYGQAISRTTYAALNALASAAGYAVYGAGDGSTTFNLPDMRGRASLGKDNMGGVTPSWVDGAAIGRITAVVSGINGAVLGAAGGTEGISLVTGQLPAHNHGGTTGNDSPDHSHSGSTGTESADHGHAFSTGGASANHTHQVVNALIWNGTYLAQQGGSGPYSMPVSTVQSPQTGYWSSDHSHSGGTGGRDTAHTHSFGTGGASARHAHSIGTDGTGSLGGPATSAVRVVQPSIVVNKMMRAL
jgi:microcystin-dependent protein